MGQVGFDQFKLQMLVERNMQEVLELCERKWIVWQSQLAAATVTVSFSVSICQLSPVLWKNTCPLAADLRYF